LKVQGFNQLAIALASVQPRWLSSLPAARSGDLIVTASGFGSLGDLAMIEGLQTLLRDDSESSPWIAAWRPDPKWAEVGRVHEPPNTPRRAWQYFSWRRPARERRRMYLIGADVLDGRYSVAQSVARLEFCRFFASFGCEVTITGFSFNGVAPEQVCQAFRALPESVRLCARDPVSRARVEQLIGREVEQVADLAFLLHAQREGPRASAALSWIAGQRARGSSVYAFCPCRLAVHSKPGSASDSESARADVIVDFFSEAAHRLRSADPAAAFVLLAHDVRSTHNDHALCMRIAERIGSSDTTLLVPPDATPGEIKGILADCDGLLTGRMHCGIAALGAGTPAAFLDYQGKVEGLLQLFGLETAIELGAGHSDAADRAANLLHSFRRESERFRRQIADRLPEVLALSVRNVPAIAAAAAPSGVIHAKASESKASRERVH
jgi:polysaccharide pyruvyl transferase WcaK-like protein